MVRARMAQVGSAQEVMAVMPSRQVFTSRLRGRSLLDSDGLAIGRVRDVVILPAAGHEPPRALGLVVTLQRRRIFVNLNGIAEISIDGAHLSGGTVDLDRFTRRAGEILASELYGKQTEDGTVADVAILPREQRRVGWEVSALAIAHGRGLRHRRTTVVPWDKYPDLFRAGPMADQLTSLRELQPADLAAAAGGLMTSQPLIVTPDVSVAEVLARVRDPDMPVTTAVQVFVCEPPIITPTGRFLGTVGFQRLLRRAPATKVGDCVQSSVFVRPDLPERELAARLAAYNLVSVAVCDEDGRLLGAFTVDDLLDHVLPDDWRKTGG